MTLVEAINAVESNLVTLQNADGASAAADAKFQAAVAAKTDADKADVDAAKAFNASLDDMIAVATAAKRPVPADAPVVVAE